MITLYWPLYKLRDINIAKCRRNVTFELSRLKNNSFKTMKIFTDGPWYSFEILFDSPWIRTILFTWPGKYRCSYICSVSRDFHEALQCWGLLLHVQFRPSIKQKIVYHISVIKRNTENVRSRYLLFRVPVVLIQLSISFDVCNNLSRGGGSEERNATRRWNAFLSY